MSCELFIHSKRETNIDRAEITDKMRALGWDVVFIADLRTMSLASTGRPNDEETVFGWRNNPVLASNVMETLARQDNTGVERLYAEGLIALCAFMELACYDEDEIKELYDPAEIRADYLETIKSAKASYSICLTGRSDSCYQFQEALWHAIGDITKGLLEDPQTGALFFYNEKPS